LLIIYEISGVADFRDENDFAYIQYPCRDVPWNVSTPKNHTPIQQRQISYNHKSDNAKPLQNRFFRTRYAKYEFIYRITHINKGFHCFEYQIDVKLTDEFR
jgi:hypothetical protein